MNYRSEAYGVLVGSFMSVQPTSYNHGNMTNEEDKDYIRVDTPNGKTIRSCRKPRPHFMLCFCAIKP